MKYLLRYTLIVTVGFAMFLDVQAFQGGGRPTASPSSGESRSTGPRAPRRPPRRDSTPLAPAHKIPAGTLAIKSTPPNCSVILNGKPVGTTDGSGNLRLTVPKPGQYVLIARKPDYRDQQRVVQVTAGQESAVEISLSVIPATLNLKSNIMGAQIKIGGVGEFVEQVNGYSLAPGSYTVEVSKPGYRKATRAFEALPAKTVNLDMTLEPLPPEEALSLAEQYFRARDFDTVVAVCGIILSSQPSHAGANLLAGYSHYQAMRYNEALTFLQTSMALNQQVNIPVKHYEKVSSRDQLFAGTLTLRRGTMAYQSTDRPWLDFTAPAAKIYELKFEPEKGGRLYVQVGIIRDAGKKEKKEKFYFHPSASTITTLGNKANIDCGGNCQQELRALYQLFSRVRQ